MINEVTGKNVTKLRCDENPKILSFWGNRIQVQDMLKSHNQEHCMTTEKIKGSHIYANCATNESLPECSVKLGY